MLDLDPVMILGDADSGSDGDCGVVCAADAI